MKPRNNFTIVCVVCGSTKDTYVRPHNRRPETCSKSCTLKRRWETDPGARERVERTGPDHPLWRGDAVSKRNGRKRALKLYPAIGPCSRCGAEKAERHHIDENTLNNSPDNIEALCRRCHMEKDGRMALVREQMRRIQPLSAAARWPK